MIFKSRGLLLSFILLSGCNLGPSYRVPPTEVPDSWKSQETIETPVVEDPSPFKPWWEIFNDPLLNELENCAIQNNRNIYTAIERIFHARALAGIRGAELYPQVNARFDYDNIGALVKIFGIPQLPGIPKIPNIIRAHYVNYSLPLCLKYELDLFGKFKNIEKSALLNVQSEEMSLLSTQLIVTSELASDYFQLRSFDKKLDILIDTIKVRQDAVNINQDRFNSGFLNYADVTRSESLLYSAKYEYLRTKRQRALKENNIAVLIGIPASSFQIPHSPLLQMPPIIPAGIPSTILKQRPDILQLERNAASEHALIGAAYASFFPDISLTGALGFLSPDFKDFLTWKSRLWFLGGSVVESIFDGYRNISNLQLSWAKFREASGDYQQGVLVAFREVEDALSNLELEFMEMEWVEKTVKSSEETLFFLKDRYSRGLTSYLDVIESERTLLDSQLVLIDLLSERYLATVGLIKAIGGSWVTSDPCLENDLMASK